MGCSSSKVIRSENKRDKLSLNTKINRPNNINHNKSNNLLMSPRKIDIMEHSTENFQNVDILDRLMAKPLAAAFYTKIFQYKNINHEMENEFKGLYHLIKPEIEDLARRYELTFDIPKDHFEIDLKSFKLEFTPCNEADIDLYIPLFIFEILIYPKSFIKKLEIKSFTFINSLNFVTTEYEQYRAACPEYYKTMSLYYCAKERNSSYIRTVIHHELFHFCDFIDDGTYDDPKWNKFNSHGFKYGKGGAYEREWKPLNPDTRGFLNFYSTTGIEEDKAEIFQFIISDPDKAFQHEDEIVNKKVFYVANFLKRFDEVGFGDNQNDFFSILSKHRKKYSYL